MKAPKLLPWMARKAGLSDELALKLWRRAAGESENLCGCCDSSDYHAATFSRFVDLVADESGVVLDEAVASTPVSWIGRQQKRMTQLNTGAAQDTYRLWQSNWDKFFAAQRNSAWLPATCQIGHTEGKNRHF